MPARRAALPARPATIAVHSSLVRASLLIAALSFNLSGASVAGAQQPETTARPAGAAPSVQPERQRAAIDRLSAMVGDWRGEGWIEHGNGRSTFRGGERVQRKIDGLALLVEGNFNDASASGAGSAQGAPVHNTLAVISFDPRTRKYRFTTWLATGSSGEHELELIDDGWRWMIVTPGATIRYSATFTGDEWLEIGEIHQGDRPWRQFFEMRLRRVASER